ncbi:wyosine base formation domain-containing protein [Kocuria rosea subsp. polaris]|uniref:Wyosine base formation domain-containing protein n=1 Tax=Kocuria rosea subsp. polaris TaxID=136273 RepID=A0A0W8IMX3_KOCRO|nr:TIGR03084 family metal-binding protein [Kocuria polaris]KUG61487.1 wyosine base formation domain-containing protein [Kocuria polaris]
MTNPDLTALLADLRVEGDLLEALLRELPDSGWDSPTPAEGWTIRHQVAHLTWTERTVLTALEEPKVFAQLRERFRAEADVVDRGAQEGAARPPAPILASWQDSRRRVLERLSAVPEGKHIPWIGPPMGAPMMASARIMETFAHGQDVRDALGVPPVASHRLRHVAHLGVATRDYAFRQRRLDPPAEPFRVELTHEDETWTWGPAVAAQRVHGPALDFALLATRRRHRQDGSLVAEGPDADAWLDIVQAFAGRPGPGRTPLSQST